MLRTVLVTLGLLAAFAAGVRAEIAVLANGLTLKLDSHREQGSELVLVLKGGGEITLPTAAVRGFVADEVMEEIAAGAGNDLRALATAAAERADIDPELVLAVVSVESGFQPHAVSPKGAQGLMQLMPQTARSLGVGDSFDPAQNLDGGARHLGSLLTLYGGDLRRALAAYNAGQGAVARHGGVPPYPETRAYVKKVISSYRDRARTGREASEKAAVPAQPAERAEGNEVAAEPPVAASPADPE